MRREQPPLVKNINFITGMLMAIFYMAVGIYLLVSRIEFGYLTPQLQFFLGLLIVVYGLFRMIRALQQLKQR